MEWAQRLEQAGGLGGGEASDRASQTEGVVQGLTQAEVGAQLSTQGLELQREAEQRLRAELHSEQLEATRQQVNGQLLAPAGALCFVAGGPVSVWPLGMRLADPHEWSSKAVSPHPVFGDSQPALVFAPSQLLARLSGGPRRPV